ncbi:unnamed protein product [Linum tenue]|uniref:non-specific serine/threonine protein kinase n=1 Tax=Linum tenue TaxID=586396 RepID=A0AAV0IJN6_9ROSI|nr:unnamed protein product [Linum tenue]
MHLFRWLHLPLFMLVQLLQLSSTVQIRHETLFACDCERTLCNKQSTGWIEGYPCLRQSASLKHRQLQTQGVVSLRIAKTGDGSNGVPTLTPAQSDDDTKAWKRKVAAIAGGVGALLLVIIIAVIVYLRIKKLASQTSETESSEQSPTELEIVETPTYASPRLSSTSFLRLLTVEELKLATRSFSDSNIIGEGLLGLVYKGLLLDGSIAAIKKNIYHPVPNFANEVGHLASVQNQHLVKLIGYCEDRKQQFLVSEFISNGNVGQYLYGLRYLHSLVPPFLHLHFRTSNVLVDENFTAKVSDYGIRKLVAETQHPGSSSSVDALLHVMMFLRSNSSRDFSVLSDVYSYGVFLLELISGREAHGKYQSSSDQNLLLQVSCTDNSQPNKHKTVFILFLTSCSSIS